MKIVQYKPFTTKPKELVSACQRWQKRLRLSDWKIDLVLDHRTNPMEAGCCDYDGRALTAKISIYAFGDHGDEPHAWEITLIHELLHLHFSDNFFDTEDPRCASFEVGLDRLAYNLWQAYQK